jgi:hypothetical protein
MWPQDYPDRLRQWHDLRQTCRGLDEPERWLRINDWWWRAPMIDRGLEWHLWPHWPDPWDLLCQTAYSDLDRALGIVYTVLMLDIDPCPRASVVFDGQDNLVWLDDGKYILNWAPGQLLNIRSHPRSPVRTIPDHQIQQIITGTR